MTTHPYFTGQLRLLALYAGAAQFLSGKISKSLQQKRLKILSLHFALHYKQLDQVHRAIYNGGDVFFDRWEKRHKPACGKAGQTTKLFEATQFTHAAYRWLIKIKKANPLSRQALRLFLWAIVEKPHVRATNMSAECGMFVIRQGMFKKVL